MALMASAASWRPGDGVVLAERRSQFGVSPPGPNSSARTRPTLVSRSRRAKARTCVGQLVAFSIAKAAMPSSRSSSRYLKDLLAHLRRGTAPGASASRGSILVMSVPPWAAG
jgi:hypothetical protein